MRIKDAVKPYYHNLYTVLKHADHQLHKYNEDQMVNVMMEDIVRLDALISLLVYVDHTIPVIRCQKAFANLKSEIRGLYYLYSEKKLISHRQHAQLEWQISKGIELELEQLAKEFQSHSHELYLNTVHVTESAIAAHVNSVSDAQHLVGILAYFTNCIEEIIEKNIDEHLAEVGYLIRSLLANLQFVAYASKNRASLENEAFYPVIVEAVSLFRTQHIYQMTLENIDNDNASMDEFRAGLQPEYEANMKGLRSAYNSITAATDRILNYVRRSIIREVNISEDAIRESIHARNVIHSYT